MERVHALPDGADLAALEVEREMVLVRRLLAFASSDSASAATRSPAAMTDFVVMWMPFGTIVPIREKSSAHSFVVFVRDSGKLPAVHHVASSDMVPRAHAARWNSPRRLRRDAYSDSPPRLSTAKTYKSVRIQQTCIFSLLRCRTLPKRMVRPIAPPESRDGPRTVSTAKEKRHG